MKQLTCEVCGGNDLLKQDGVFVCQSCGCKYSAQEVKKLMVQISEPVKVEGIQSVELMLDNAKNLINIKQIDKAIEVLRTITTTYSSEYRGWWELTKALNYELFFNTSEYVRKNSHNYNMNLEIAVVCHEMNSIAKTEEFDIALRIADDLGKKEINREYNSYLERLEKQINILKQSMTGAKNKILSNMAQLHGFYGCSKDEEYWKENTADYYFGFRYIESRLYLFFCQSLFIVETIKSDGCVVLGNGIHYMTYFSGSSTNKFFMDEAKQHGVSISNSNASFKIIIREASKDYVKIDFQAGNILRKVVLTPNINAVIAMANVGYGIREDLNKTALLIKYVNMSPSEINRRYKNNGCYIATSVYGSYDCPQVWTLRRYRDYNLAKTWYGRAFIKIYYAISPTLVKWFGNTTWFQNFWKNKLDRMVCNLKNKGYEDKPYNDKNW